MTDALAAALPDVQIGTLAGQAHEGMTRHRSCTREPPCNSSWETVRCSWVMTLAQNAARLGKEHAKGQYLDR